MFWVLFSEVPVEPDAPSARRWLTEELADPLYHQGPGIVQRILDWVLEWISRMLGVGDGTNPVWLAVVIMAVIAVIVTVAALITGPVRRRRRVAASVDVLGDNLLSADELRARAVGHAAQNDWRMGVLDLFRALVRSLEERAILDVRPGRTADEAARAAGLRLPPLESDLRHAGQMFDAVFYGEQVVDASEYAWLKDVETRVRAARPELPVGVA